MFATVFSGAVKGLIAVLAIMFFGWLLGKYKSANPERDKKVANTVGKGVVYVVLCVLLVSIYLGVTQ